MCLLRRILTAACFVALGSVWMIGLAAQSGRADEAVIATDHFVPHVSTVPANAGQLVGLYVREKATVRTAASPQPRVVLFVHGATVSSAPDFDLNFEDYSWMDY